MNTDPRGFPAPFALHSIGNGFHSRKTSAESASSYSVPSSTHLSTPNDSPPFDMTSAGQQHENAKFHQQQQHLVGGFGGGGRQHDPVAFRNARYNPYGGGAGVPRHNSLSAGSDSGYRSSSSEADDYQNIGLSTPYGGYNPAASQPDLLYGGSASMYNHVASGRQTPMMSGPPVTAFHGHQPAGHGSSGVYGNVQPGQSLEECAAAVRQATTTSASDRAKHIFVQAWLTSTYAPWQDGNVPRQGLYNSYRRVCEQFHVPHVNTATLGKAIRLCFPNIKTRRLGVRGNSKYHYCGIRPGTVEEAQWLQDFVERTNNLRPGGPDSRPPSQSGRSSQEEDGGDDDEDDMDDVGTGAPSNGLLGEPARNRPNPLKTETDGVLADQGPTFLLDDKTPTVSGGFGVAQAQYGPQPGSGMGGPGGPAHKLGQPNVPESYRATGGALAQGQSVTELHGFPTLEDAVGRSDSDSQFSRTAREIWTWYIKFLDSQIDATRQFRMDLFESNLVNFWTGLSPEQREIVQAPSMAGSIARADCLIYDEVLEILRSSVLTAIQAPTLASVRSLAERIERVLLEALRDFLPTFYESKVELAARFAHLTLRFLDIYQVTQALSSVLSQRDQLAEMSRSWRDIDFESVRNQAALVCNCQHEDLQQLLQVEFAQVLDNLQRSSEPIKEIMAWSDRCCEKLLGGAGIGAPPTPVSEPPMSSRSLLIRWGYVTSQIMRDLTIRSDPAFGAFQILKLFMDDWIAFNVLRNVALSNASVAAATVAEPQIQHQQYLALSPGGNSFTGMHHNPLGAASLMATTPTTANLLAAMNGGDPFGTGGPHGSSGPHHHHSFGYDAYTQHLDPSSSAFDFGGNGPSLGVEGGLGTSNANTPSTVGTGVGGDTEMSPAAAAGGPGSSGSPQGGPVKVED